MKTKSARWNLCILLLTIIVIPLKLSSQENNYKWLYSKESIYISIDSLSFKRLVIEGEIIGATKPAKRDIIYVLTFNLNKSFLLEFDPITRTLAKKTELPIQVKTRSRNWGDKIIASTSDGERIAMVMNFDQAQIFLYNYKTNEYKVINSGIGTYTNYINIDLNDEFYYLGYDNDNIQKIDIYSLSKTILPLFNSSSAVSISKNRAIFASYEGNLRYYDFTKNRVINVGITGNGDKNSLKTTNDEKIIYALNVENGEIHSTNLKRPSIVKSYKLSDNGYDLYSMFIQAKGKVYVAFANSEKVPVFIEGDFSDPHIQQIRIE